MSYENTKYTSDDEAEVIEDSLIITERCSKIWNKTCNERNFVKDMAKELYSVVYGFDNILQNNNIGKIDESSFIKFISSITTFDILKNNEGKELC